MTDRLTALRLFTRVARRGSFSAAAREVGLSQPSVSKIIAGLEREVGTSLLVRTTRAVTLTDAGASYLSRVEHALAELEEAENIARGGSQLRGIVRVALTSSIAVREVIPRLPAFASRHPALQIVLMIDDERRNLIADGVDLAFRLGPLESSSMIARPMGSWPFAILAAPAYLASHGHPVAPSDLRGLSIIAHAESKTHLWKFRRADEVETIELTPRLIVSSNEGCIAAARAGFGVTSAATLSVRRELAEGSLIRILPDFDIGTLDVHLLFPAAKSIKPAARALADFVLESGL